MLLFQNTLPVEVVSPPGVAVEQREFAGGQRCAAFRSHTCTHGAEQTPDAARPQATQLTELAGVAVVQNAVQVRLERIGKLGGTARIAPRSVDEERVAAIIAIRCHERQGTRIDVVDASGMAGMFRPHEAGT